MVRALPVALMLALAAAGTASASVTVTTNAQRPSLRVDARGYAEVSWTARGVRRTLLIPPRGRAPLLALARRADRARADDGADRRHGAVTRTGDVPRPAGLRILAHARREPDPPCGHVRVLRLPRQARLELVRRQAHERGRNVRLDRRTPCPRAPLPRDDRRPQ